jgi:hypothetical protein
MKEMISILAVVVAAVAMLVFGVTSRRSAPFKFEAHDAVCSYCEHEQYYEKGVAEESCGRDNFIGPTETGHVHECDACGEKYVCSFACTLSDETKQKFESGLRSR